MYNKILWLSTKTGRIFNSYEKAFEDAKVYCLIYNIDFSKLTYVKQKKYIMLVFNHLDK